VTLMTAMTVMTHLPSSTAPLSVPGSAAGRGPTTESGRSTRGNPGAIGHQPPESQPWAPPNPADTRDLQFINVPGSRATGFPDRAQPQPPRHHRSPGERSVKWRPRRRQRQSLSLSFSQTVWRISYQHRQYQVGADRGDQQHGHHHQPGVQPSSAHLTPPPWRSTPSRQERPTPAPRYARRPTPTRRRPPPPRPGSRPGRC
jgi:hypothetical protein